MKKQIVRKSSSVSDAVSSLLVAIGLALVIRTVVVQAFFIPSGSMEDSLLVGDYLLANKFVYGAPVDVPFTTISLFRLPRLRDPKAGDIVIFRSPIEPDKDLIKRCVAVGGQEVIVVDKTLFVDGKPFLDPPFAKYTDSRVYRAVDGNRRDNFGPYIVPDGHYFMMGDNRDNSFDSRYWLAVPDELIKGQAMSIYYSWEPDVSGPYYNGLSSLPHVLFSWFSKLPSRVRLERLGNVIR
jgi:signal peptidase I